MINVQVLGAGDDSFALNTLDVLAGVNTGEERVTSCSLPVPATGGISRNIHHRTKTVFYRLSITRFLNAQRQRGWHSRKIDTTLASELLPQRLPTFQHDCLVPCGGNTHAGRENGVVISVACTNGCVLETPIEVEARSFSADDYQKSHLRHDINAYLLTS